MLLAADDGTMRHLPLPLLASLALGLLTAPTGCRRAETGPIGVSLIDAGDVRPLHADLPAPLRAVVAPGLVRFDRDGQIVPGVAVRWAILEDGRDYIFRTDDTSGVPAERLVRRLRTALRAAPAPLRAVLDSIESVAAVTSTVVEIRLSEPQPDLLALLARPEFGLDAGGPMRVVRDDRAGILLRGTAAGEEPRPAPVLLRQERVGHAVARFVAGQARFVSGGTFADLPVTKVAALPRNALTFDLASGLFGLVPRRREGIAADAAVRRAMAMAIDRDRIVAAIGATGQAKATTIAGSTIELPLGGRIAVARRMLAGHDSLPPVTVAMPAGPGARLLFALLQRDWARIGVAAMATAPDADADFALLDMVAPPGSLAAIACAASVGCDPRDRQALLDPPYIPIATPVRWSLVDCRLDGFAENAMAAHPLDQLRRSD